MKEKIIDFFQDKVVVALDKFATNSYVKAIQAGMTAPIGATVIGSIFTVLGNPPFGAEQTGGFVVAWRNWAEANSSWLDLGYAMTMEAIALYALIGLVVALAAIKKKRPTNLIITAMMAFFIICVDLVEAEGGMAMTTTWLSAKGLFTAVIVGIGVVQISNFLGDKGIKIKLPASVPPNISEPLENLFNNIIVITLAVIIRVGLQSAGLTLPGLINSLFAPLLSTSDTLWAALVFTFVLRGLWFFGIHGNSVVMSVMAPIFLSNLALNIEAFKAGTEMPTILNQSFQAVINVGMLPMCIAMLMVCKSAQLKAISRIGLAPSIFGIGEPITFGVPIVLNFKILIPYMGTFLFSTTAFYLATAWGFMNKCVVNIPFTVPGPLKAFLATLDIRAVFIWVVIVIIDVIIFLPFMKNYDKSLLKLEEENYVAE